MVAVVGGRWKVKVWWGGREGVRVGGRGFGIGRVGWEGDWGDGEMRWVEGEGGL